MHGPNWWMMALSFVLGLLLTSALMIRRVTREVPVSRPPAEVVEKAKTSGGPSRERPSRERPSRERPSLERPSLERPSVERPGPERPGGKAANSGSGEDAGS